MKTKQVIIIRKDLKMRKGKMVAQGAHAAMKVILSQGSIKRSDSGILNIDMTEQMQDWLANKFTKICVGVDSEQQLLELYEQAETSGIVCSLIQDSGLTEFDGIPTYTAVAIGPDSIEKIDVLTGDLKLL